MVVFKLCSGEAEDSRAGRQKLKGNKSLSIQALCFILLTELLDKIKKLKKNTPLVKMFEPTYLIQCLNFSRKVN